LSVDFSEGFVIVTIGDNDLAFFNEEDQEDVNRIWFQGPSIGKGKDLGKLSDFIQPDAPFELILSYSNEKLSYSINNQEIYTGVIDIPPAGLVGVKGEFDGNLKIYDLVCKGRFKPVSEFYTKEFLLDRAHKSLAKAADKVKDDPNRPAYHFQPPANWNNDPNGMLFYGGYYHMFYQHNPYADRWDWMHWGHARSKDLVHWEHLPIALWPSVEKGEEHCFSGSGYIKDDGKPILFYTSIGHEDPEHWAAIPEDDELRNWEKHPHNPLIVMEDHGDQYIEDWRDPFLFREAGETYMVIGGHPEGVKGSIMMYKALNKELTDWKYLGSPFSGEEGNWECPNFFKVGEKYVLIYSPHGRVEYYSGTMDFEKFKFTPEYHGMIDNGSEWNYYAPNTLQKEDGRRILFGWIPGFKENQGWQSAISLPRDLSINEKGKLIQKPVPELKQLRGEVVTRKEFNLQNTSLKPDIKYLQFEMMINIANAGTDHLGFRFNHEEGEASEITITPQTLHFGDETVDIEPVLEEKIKLVQLFFDCTVVEVFVNGGILCATKVIYPDKENLDFEIFSKNETILEEVNVWELNSIWN